MKSPIIAANRSDMHNVAETNRGDHTHAAPCCKPLPQTGSQPATSIDSPKPLLNIVYVANI